MKTKNVRLLIVRLETALDSPEAARFNMRHFGNVFFKQITGALPEIAPVCKTQACLAGEAVLAVGTGRILESGGIALGEGDYPAHVEILDQATKDLGLSRDQATRLFFFKGWKQPKLGWPDKFAEAYENAKTPQGRLYVAIRRVEHFLATKGRE